MFFISSICIHLYEQIKFKTFFLTLSVINLIEFDFFVWSSFIYHLSRLRVLVLGGNFLKEIPDTVGDLHQLHALTLCDNLIEELPASIARLTNLEQLLIHKNRLRYLPPDIIALHNLNEVSD